MFSKIFFYTSLLFLFSMAVAFGIKVKNMAAYISTDPHSNRSNRERFIENRKQKDAHVIVGDERVRVEVADTSGERTMGLMFRDELAADSGMLFVFEETDHHSFWMRNTKIPLDILWISSDLTIVHIEKNVAPCKIVNCPSYTPDATSKYVLEVNGGWSDEHAVEVGDRVELGI